MRVALALLPLLLLSTLPVADAQINGEHEFASSFAYGSPDRNDTTTIVSAAMEAHVRQAEDTFGFFTVTGFAVQDAEVVCWKGRQNGCASGDLRIRVLDGGSVGVRMPDPVDGTYVADHVLATWMDFDDGEDLNTYGLGRTLLAPSVGGRMAFGAFAPIPDPGAQQVGGADFERMGGLAPLDGRTTLSVQGVQNTIFGLGCQPPSCTFTGKDVILGFSGDASIPAFQTDFALLPFSTGSSADFEPAGDDAVSEGLQFARINEMLGRINQANAGSGDEDTPQEIDGSQKELETLLQETLSGALVQLPPPGAPDFGAAFRLNRFQHMSATDTDGTILTDGETVFRVAGGEVTGAQPLYGFWLFQLPWWGYLLWVVAIGLFIARMVVKPEKTHERWDQYKWIGLVFAILMGALVFVLWDLEMAHVFGTSLFTSDAGGGTYWAVLGIQVATLLLVFGVVAAPLQIIIKNGLLLGRQGTFMGLGTGTGILLSYVLGATLLLSYLDLMLDLVL